MFRPSPAPLPPFRSQVQRPPEKANSYQKRRCFSWRIWQLAAFALATLPDAEARTWTHANGQTFEADFVSATEKNVTLRRADEKPFTQELARLSAGDQEFVRSQTTAPESTPEAGRAEETVATRMEDIPVRIEKWSEAKEGLRIGMHVADADWRIGGRVRVELWLHNAGMKNLTFNCAGMAHQDQGVSVGVVGAYGRERSAGGIVGVELGKSCTLPAGHVLKIKSFMVAFAGSDGPVALKDAKVIHSLPAGAYKLTCSWLEGLKPNAQTDWKGALSAPHREFTLTDTDELGVKRAPKLMTLPNEFYPKLGLNYDKLPMANFHWSEARNGVSVGLRAPEESWRIGSVANAELWLHNSGDRSLRFQYTTRPDIGLRLFMKGTDGSEHEAEIIRHNGYPLFRHALLTAGHAVKVRDCSVMFLPPGGKQEGGEPHYSLAAGEYRFRAELTLPGIELHNDSGQQVTPAEGEWIGTLKSPAFPMRLETGETAGGTPVPAPLATGGKPRPCVWQKGKYTAIALQSSKDMIFVLVYEGFARQGLLDKYPREAGKWDFAGDIHLVGPADQMMDDREPAKRIITVRHSSGEPAKLYINGIACHLAAPAAAQGNGDQIVTGRTFILRDEGEPIQSDRTFTLQSEKDLITIGDFAAQELLKEAAGK